MKWIALYAGLAACAAATGATAEDAKPTPMDPPAANLTGTWSVIIASVGGFETGVDNHGQNPGSCTFQQDGNRLRGTCKTVTLQGPISGVISGPQVAWRWLYNAGTVGEPHAFAVAVFNAALQPDGKIAGGFTNYPTLDKFNPSFEYKQDFKYIRPTNFTANKQAGPS
jgi:hypothetical protein